jgi:DNA-binding response OmpR family regulator
VPGLVVLAEDDPAVSALVRLYLTRDGFGVEAYTHGDAALQAILGRRPVAAVLDIGLPGMDGIEVCRRLRERGDRTPVLFVTARDDEVDRILGLELGADDYVTKPFSPRELVLRVGLVLRHAAPADTAASLLVDGGLRVDPAARTAELDGAPLALTTREFDLLAFLVAHPGRAFTREELLKLVWGWDFGDQSTVTVHVRRLREKIEKDPTSPLRIATIWGTGYRYDLSS